MKAINITAYTSDSAQIHAIKAFMTAMKIKFEFSKGKPYNADFVAKILQGDEDIKNGKGKKIFIEELEKLCK